MDTLNLGILAHVDAGKTSLTERLLYAAGVIDHVGRVDDGDTQTDTLALERRRGITIKSAVVSFEVDGTVVNLIDTPGHPDFIAEVERVLDVLDGVVLVVSAVEGVQAQTRVLMRTLRRLGLPVLIFVNKIDRSGARSEALLGEIAAKLSIDVVSMGSVRDLGTKDAAFVPYAGTAAEVVEPLADHDDVLLTSYLAERPMTAERVRGELAEQTRTGQVHPVFFGSAITGAGVDELTAGIVALLPTAGGDVARRALGFGVQDRTRVGRPEGGTDPDVQRQPAGPRPVALRPGRGHGYPDQRGRARRRYVPRGVDGRSDRSGLGPGSRPYRRPGGSSAPRRRRGGLCPAHLGNRCSP